MDKTKQLGQYFTPAFVADFMVSLSSKSKNANVLVPASGKGVFLSSLKKIGFKKFIGYEIDSSLLGAKDKGVVAESFISADFDKKFDLIIGNPPYVRWKNLGRAQKLELQKHKLWNEYFNGLSDYLYIFILKSVELLNEGGELIFITPEYWLNTLHSKKLRNYLLDHGYVDQIYHFSETPIFNKITSSIIIFKYIKTAVEGKKTNRISIYRYSSRKRLSAEDLIDITRNKQWFNFSSQQFQKNESWILAPNHIKDELQAYEDKCKTNYQVFHNPTAIPEDEVPYVRLGDIANIANGLVSGRDKVFQLPEDIELSDFEKRAVLKVIKAKDMHSFISLRHRPYIFLNEKDISEADLASKYPNFYKRLLPHRNNLDKRYNYNRDIKYWQWVFLRSMSLFKKRAPKIFVPGKERITNKERLRFCIAKVDEFPTQDVTAVYFNDNVKESIYYFLALLNSKLTYDWVKYKGLIKGGVAEFSERPLSSIPIKLIDWSNKNDVAQHDRLVEVTKRYISEPNDNNLAEIDRSIALVLQ